MADAQTPVLTDDEIAAAVAPIYGNRVAAAMGRSDDIRTARLIERAFLAKIAAQAPAQPAEAVAWEYRNQHGNPFLSHTDPHKWHPHDQAGFGQFRALVYAAPSQPGPTMADALAAGDGTLHGAVDHWQEQALAGRAVMQQALEKIAALDYSHGAVNCAAYEAVCIARKALYLT